MSLFLAMLSKLFPLYATMGAGFGLGKHFGNLGQALAQIQIYLIMPVLFFTSMMRLTVSADILVMPFAFFTISLLISATTYFFARKAGTEYAPLLAQGGGAANLGYLGIPMATILLPSDFLPVYIFTLVGGTFYEFSFGYYWVARGKYTPADAMKSLLKLPVLYAAMAGLALNVCGIRIPEAWQGVERDFLGACIVLGSLIIGLGLAQNKKLTINIRLLSLLYAIKFLVWPAVTVASLACLRLTPFAVPLQYEPIFLLMSILPMAANTAVYASLLNVHPEEAAAAVALSTLLSIFIIPAYVLFFGFANV